MHLRLHVPKPGKWFVISSYALLSAVSFFPWILGRPVADPLLIFGFILLQWIGVLSILPKLKWIHWLLLPAYLAVPAQIYLQTYFHQDISTHHINLLLETSPAEAREFLGNRIWGLALAILALTIWFYVTWQATKRLADSLSWKGKLRNILCIFTLLTFGLIVFYHYNPPVYSPLERLKIEQEVLASPQQSTIDAAASVVDRRMEHQKASTTGEYTRAIVDEMVKSHPMLVLKAMAKDRITAAWPFNLWWRLIDFYDNQRLLRKLEKQSASFHFNARQSTGNDLPQVIVLVIGESSRYDRWSINGYGRDTNPLLSKEANLVSFNNLITPISATRLSVPVIMTRKPAIESNIPEFSERSLLSAYHEAGFKTWWLSNQTSLGEFDTPITVFAHEADSSEFLNLGSYKDTSSYDEVLFAPLAKAMKDPAPKKLIVLHTLGSHWNYSNRYPIEFNHWTPSLTGYTAPDMDAEENKQLLNNSYDNSILYTDWFLDHVIDRLKAFSGSAALVFLSDHGENLYDGTCTDVFHGHSNVYDFHIPGFMWYSDAYKKLHPDKVIQLHIHKDAKLATENIFHSMLDASDIEYPGMQLDRSFLSSLLTFHERRVGNEKGWNNYDNSVFEGDCKKVIDKEPPIPMFHWE